MGGRASRLKGKGGEREFANLLSEALGIKFERNLEQTRGGGFDLKGIDKLAIEVKRQETINLTAWWKQALEQAEKGQYPVLAYRQSRKPWMVMIPLAMLAPRYKWKDEAATVDLDTFIAIVKRHILKK
jgi:hypothetical protein